MVERKIKMKKFASVLICLFLLASCCSLPAFAEPAAGSCGKDVTWSFNAADGKLTLAGSGEVDAFPLVDTEIVNEETGGTFTQQQPTPPWEAFRAQIAAVEVAEGVTVLPRECFARLPALKTAVLANSITDLGVMCFSDCAALEAANLPANLTKLVYTFVGCTELRQVMALPEAVQMIDSPFAASGVSTVVLPGSMKKVDDVCFKWANNITTVFVDSGIESIGMCAFQGAGIKTLIVPATVTQLGTEFCQGCGALAYVSLPDGIKTLPTNAFGACTALEAIRLPGDLETIEPYAFNNCNQLKRITIPASVTSIGDGAFNLCDSLTDIYYQGTEAQWAAITISETYNAPLEAATVHFNAGEDPNAFLPGDVNGDRTVTAEDARLTLRAAVSLEQFEAGGRTAITCDYDMDGFISAADARLTLRAAVGLPNA